ncbi:MAG: hypothetical protein NTX50_08960 [Candidatus Sumerlaeota bacterium]|nr:hypothetical protein [Candidatus Sumerlaeota bacterium]
MKLAGNRRGGLKAFLSDLPAAYLTSRRLNPRTIMKGGPRIQAMMAHAKHVVDREDFATPDTPHTGPMWANATLRAKFIAAFRGFLSPRIGSDLLLSLIIHLAVIYLSALENPLAMGFAPCIFEHGIISFQFFRFAYIFANALNLVAVCLIFAFIRPAKAPPAKILVCLFALAGDLIIFQFVIPIS